MYLIIKNFKTDEEASNYINNLNDGNRISYVSNDICFAYLYEYLNKYIRGEGDIYLSLNYPTKKIAERVVNDFNNFFKNIKIKVVNDYYMYNRVDKSEWGDSTYLCFSKDYPEEDDFTYYFIFFKFEINEEYSIISRYIIYTLLGQLIRVFQYILLYEMGHKEKFFYNYNELPEENIIKYIIENEIGVHNHYGAWSKIPYTLEEIKLIDNVEFLNKLGERQSNYVLEDGEFWGQKYGTNFYYWIKEMLEEEE